MGTPSLAEKAAAVWRGVNKPSEAEAIGGKSAEHWGQTTLDAAGLEVTARYRDGTSKVVDNWTLSPSGVNSSEYGQKSASLVCYIVKFADAQTLPDNEIDELIFAAPPSRSAWGFDEQIADWASAVVLAHKAQDNVTPYVRVNNAGLTFTIGESENVPALNLQPGQNRTVPSIKAKLTNTPTKNATFQDWAITVHNVKLENTTTKYVTVTEGSFVYGETGIRKRSGRADPVGKEGENPFVNLLVNKCYAKGDVQITTPASSNSHAGGIVGGVSIGRVGTFAVTNSAALNGIVSTPLGSFAVRISPETSRSTYTNNIADPAMMVRGNTQGEAGTESADIHAQSTYEALGWDFGDVWEMGADEYPALRWLN